MHVVANFFGLTDNPTGTKIAIHTRLLKKRKITQGCAFRGLQDLNLNLHLYLSLIYFLFVS